MLQAGDQGVINGIFYINGLTQNCQLCEELSSLRVHESTGEYRGVQESTGEYKGIQEST